MVSDRVRGALYALACVALWGLIPVVARLGQSGLDGHQFLFWSSLLSALSVGLLAAAQGRLARLRDYRAREWTSAAVLGLLGTYLYYLLLYRGYAGGGGLEVLVVQYTWPVQVALLSVLLLGERFTRCRQLALLLGFVAVVLVLGKGEIGAISLQRPAGRPGLGGGRGLLFRPLLGAQQAGAAGAGEPDPGLLPGGLPSLAAGHGAVLPLCLALATNPGSRGVERGAGQWAILRTLVAGAAPGRGLVPGAPGLSHPVALHRLPGRLVR